MNDNLIVFIIDESGSMSSLKDDTIGGFNSIINKLKKEIEDAKISIVFFNGNVRNVIDRKALKDATNLTADDYCPCGSTALYDAIGATIDKIDRAYKKDKPNKVLLYIMTDGYENSSIEYTRPMIRKMIEWHIEKENWAFEFIGAGIDIDEEAEMIAIPKERRRKIEKNSKDYNAMCQNIYLDIEENLIIKKH